MPRGGQNKKAEGLRLLEGKTRPGEGQKAKPVPKFPAKAPRGTPKYARQLWNKYAPKLTELGILRETDQPAWEVLCLTYETIKQSEAAVQEKGILIPGARGNELVKNPALSVLAAARQQFRLMWAEFGISPASRERLGIYLEESESEMEALLFKGYFPDV